MAYGVDAKSKLVRVPHTDSVASAHADASYARPYIRTSACARIAAVVHYTCVPIVIAYDTYRIAVLGCLRLFVT